MQSKNLGYSWTRFKQCRTGSLSQSPGPATTTGWFSGSGRILNQFSTIPTLQMHLSEFSVQTFKTTFKQVFQVFKQVFQVFYQVVSRYSSRYSTYSSRQSRYSSRYSRYSSRQSRYSNRYSRYSSRQSRYSSRQSRYSSSSLGI